MKRIFAVLLGTACVLGPTAGFAQGGFGHGGGFAPGPGSGPVMRDPGLFAPVAPPVPTFESRIPAPLPPPAQPPVINGPLSETPPEM
ncbi:MAG TPA: hypothetical protein VII14_02655 [Xanthobacteraceae bacterium]|jgi:hypothetical protein|nr:hypothetical protein [Alphaproteobacteria bacterium]